MFVPTRLILIIVSYVLVFQKDYPLEVYSSSQSVPWNCGIQGKVGLVPHVSSSQSSLTQALAVRPPKAYGTLAIPKRRKKPHKRPDLGVPTYRTYVQYIPQRPSLLPGTPRDLIETLSTFHARLTPERSSSEGHSQFNSAVALAEQWGIAKELWDRPWSLVSVGEAQRLSLAIAYGFNRAEVLMLDGECFTFSP